MPSSFCPSCATLRHQNCDQLLFYLQSSCPIWSHQAYTILFCMCVFHFIIDIGLSDVRIVQEPDPYPSGTQASDFVHNSSLCSCSKICHSWIAKNEISTVVKKSMFSFFVKDSGATKSILVLPDCISLRTC